MQKNFIARIGTLVFCLATQFAIAQESLELVQQRLRKDLEYLADDQREGRGVGTKGLQDAGDYIAKRFTELGLDTKVFGGSPFQEFTVPNGFAAAKPTEADSTVKNSLIFQSSSSTELKLESEWNPMALGGNAKFEGEVVFVGYGITAKDNGYDDYEGLDVKGKVVIALRKEPLNADSTSIFTGAATSRYAYFSTKLANASQHGVAALILINDSRTAEQSDDKPLGVSDAGRPMGATQLPVLNVTRKAIDTWIQQGTGKSLAQLETQINETKKPASQALKDVKASGRTEIVPYNATVRNVAGLLPGKGELAKEYVIVGAHYDHVGMGGDGSLAPGSTAVHNGADDNGSGTISILEVARQLSKHQSENRRSILFMTFAAEERGLLGSEHYVRYPAFPLEKTVAMVNLDMVGRLGDGSVTVFGMGTAAEFSDWLDEANSVIGLDLNKQGAGLGPSDHQSFYQRDIPVFHFFTGLHGEYHRPSDDVNLIDFEGVSKIVAVVSQLTANIATKSQKPTFLKTNDRARIGPNAGRTRVTLGVSFDPNAKDWKVAQVADSSPAKSAGIEVGDTILKVGETTVSNTEELQRALRKSKVGEQVTVTVRRGDKTLELKVKL